MKNLAGVVLLQNKIICLRLNHAAIERKRK
jgi:hypothetical protein